VLLGEDCWQREAALGDKGSLVYSITTINLSEVRKLSTSEDQSGRADQWESYSGELSAQLEAVQAELAAAQGAYQSLQEIVESGADSSDVMHGELAALRAQLEEANTATAEAQAAAEEQAAAAEEHAAALAAAEEKLAELEAGTQDSEPSEDGAHGSAVPVDAPCPARKAFVCADFLFILSEDGSQVWRRHLNGTEWEMVGDAPAALADFVSNSHVAWATDEEGNVYFAADVQGDALEWQQVEMPEEVGLVVSLGVQNYPDAPMCVYAISDADENNAWMNSVDGSSGWAQLTTPEKLKNISSDGKMVWFVGAGGSIFKAAFSGSAESQTIGNAHPIHDCRRVLSDRTNHYLIVAHGTMYIAPSYAPKYTHISGQGYDDITMFDGYMYGLSGGSLQAHGYLGRAERQTAGLADHAHRPSIESRK